VKASAEAPEVARTSKKEEKNGFARRLVEFREARGMTQADLSRATGISERMIAYYERPDAQPPGPQLGALAKAVGVTTDELLGLRTRKGRPALRSPRLLRRLQMVEWLPADDQRALLKFLDALLEKRGFRPSYASHHVGRRPLPVADEHAPRPRPQRSR
jgi:transcriptional regulator with XRE-family HTH domain